MLSALIHQINEEENNQENPDPFHFDITVSS